MYTKEEHFLIKLLTNNAMQLEETIEALSAKIKDLTESNDALYRNHNILKEKYDNAIAMLHGTEPVKQEVIVQPDLFPNTAELCYKCKRYLAHDNNYCKGETGELTICMGFDQKYPIDKTSKSNDNTPHFKMQPTRRKLTTEQAQHAYNMISMGNATITQMANRFNTTVGTIGSLMSVDESGRPRCYLEIDRSKQ